MRILRQNIYLLVIILSFVSANAWSFNSTKIIEKDLDSNIVNEIENAFLFTEEESRALSVDKKSRVNIKNNHQTFEPRYGFTSSGSEGEIDIDKKTKERVAYNSYLNGQYEVALRVYKDLVAKYPADNYPKYCLALTYQKLKQFKKAKAIYFDLLKQDPKNKEDIVANLVTVLSQESPSRALFLLTKLGNQNPNNGYFLAQKAMVFDQMNNINQAINEMRKAINIEPENIEFKLNLAILLDKNKDFEEALSEYQRVLKSYNSYGEKNINIPVHQIVSRIDVVKNLI